MHGSHPNPGPLQVKAGAVRSGRRWKWLAWQGHIADDGPKSKPALAAFNHMMNFLSRGTGTQGYSITWNERKQIANRWLPWMVFVGAGANEFEDLVAAALATALGASRVFGNRRASPREFVMPM